MPGKINTAIPDVRKAAIWFVYIDDVTVNQKRSSCVRSAVGSHGREECMHWEILGVANLVSAWEVV